jgi:hypothetical protein
MELYIPKQFTLDFVFSDAADCRPASLHLEMTSLLLELLQVISITGDGYSQILPTSATFQQVGQIQHNVHKIYLLHINYP